MSDKKWLTLEEVALRLHVHIVTARRYVREGLFPASQIGKQYLIPEAALEEFLQKNLRIMSPPARGKGSPAKKRRSA